MTSTVHLISPGFAEASTASTADEVAYFVIHIDGTASVSTRNGKLPRGTAAHNREISDSQYREKMQAARKLLAEEINDLIPNSLSKMRLSRGMSQTDLALRLKTSQSHIAKIESGKVKLSWQTALKLSDALRISLDTLRPLVAISYVEAETIQQSLCITS